MAVPPEADPVEGLILKMDRGSLYSNLLEGTALMSPSLTLKSTIPDTAAGDKQESIVLLRYTTDTLDCPNLQNMDSPVVKPAPVTVTCVPPPDAPIDGVTDSRRIDASNVYCPGPHAKLASSALKHTDTLPIAWAGLTHSTTLDDSRRAFPNRLNPKRHVMGISAGIPLPVSVTTVPPESCPREGVIDTTRISAT
jgi:hypothetical protein